MDRERPEGEEGLEHALEQYVDGLGAGSLENRARLMALARSLGARGFPPAFILSSLRSSAAVLVEVEQGEPVSEAMQRPEVQKFLVANAAGGDDRAEIDTRKEVKSSERERLRQQVIAAVRDARRSKARHEIKKTRNVLMKIDQRHLRRTLGREGDELCHEINRILRSTAAMF